MHRVVDQVHHRDGAVDGIGDVRPAPVRQQRHRARLVADIDFLRLGELAVAAHGEDRNRIDVGVDRHHEMAVGGDRDRARLVGLARRSGLAAVQGVADRGDELVDFDAAAAIAIVDGALIELRATQRDVDAENELIDRDRSAAVAVADAWLLAARRRHRQRADQQQRARGSPTATKHRHGCLERHCVHVVLLLCLDR